MGLTKAQHTLITKARTAGSGELSVALDDEICTFLVATIVQDLNLQTHFPDLPAEVPPFFTDQPFINLRLNGIPFIPLLERLIGLIGDADTYFYCLAVVHKARLKYERILQAQAIPTIEQIGPRGLLQYGHLSPKSLAGFLFWRKWLFDIDNRAGQETGYIFEPIIAYAIGGVPYSAKTSPIKRAANKNAGRQVDCIHENKAYEIKLRVTIAASGQGRWKEELDFPHDCKTSGYTPILLVLDPTVNPKLNELQKVYHEHGGASYIGLAAWNHLEALAGSIMARFLELYVHTPLQRLLNEFPTSLPSLTLSMDDQYLKITVGDETLSIQRDQYSSIQSEGDELPDDL